MGIYDIVVEEFRKFMVDYNAKSKNTQGYYTHLATQGQVPDLVSTFDLGRDENSDDVPFFSTGSEHANILHYEFDVPRALLLVLQNRKADISSNLSQQYQLDPSSVVEQFVPYYRDYYKSTGVVFPVESDQYLRDLIDKSLKTFFTDDPGIVMKSDQEKLETFYYLNMMLELGGNFIGEGDTGFAVRGVIRTLPMFHLSDMSDINKTCIISIANNPRPYQHLDLATLSEVFYSGVYKILGIKHIVDSQKPHSLFTVQKIAPLKLKAENDYINNEVS